MPEITAQRQHLFDGLDLEAKQALYESLCSFFSEGKRKLFDTLIQYRTRHICVALEDVYQSHNASAVLRSCDCFGVQDVHVVENRNTFNPAGDVSVGSSKWVDYYKYPDTPTLYTELHRRGYRIVATTPHENDTLIGQLDITQPTALVFGTELTGLTPWAIEHADSYVKVPMYGFTESFNISVCAALSLFSLTERMRSTPTVNWQLTEEQQITQKLHWTLQVIKDGENVLNHLLNKNHIN